MLVLCGGRFSCRFFSGTKQFLEVFSISKEMMINEEIRANEVRVIDNDGSQLGIMSSSDALDAAIKNPLLETSIKYAKEVILNFYGDNIDVFQMKECSEYIENEVDADAEIIWGYREPDAGCEDSDFVEVTIIAAQFMTPTGAPADDTAVFGSFNADPWSDFNNAFN